MAGNNGWRKCLVGDIAAQRKNALVGGPFGSNLVKRDYVDFGVPVIRGQNMSARWICGEFAFISEMKANSLSANTARPGDLVFTQRGTLGQVALVAEHPFNRYIVSQSQMKLTTDAAKADPLFLYYVFSSPQQIDYVKRNAIQTGVPHTNLGMLRDTPLLLPPLAEQKAIAHILGTLDDKIELNRRMNETLESMARAIFKSWFVDFDPVRAKMDGRQPTGMDADTASLFPDALEHVEGELIPHGWGFERADAIADVAIGKTPPRKEQHWFSKNPSDIRWMSIRDLGASRVFIHTTSEHLTAEAVEKFRVRRIPDNTVVLSFKLTVGRVAITDGEMLSNEAIAHFNLREESAIGTEFLYCYLRNFAFESLGSTSSIATAVNSKMVRAIPVLHPVKPLVKHFEEKVGCIFERIRQLERESVFLASLRDTLLPKLLSGELRVGDAMIQVEDVVSSPASEPAGAEA